MSYPASSGGSGKATHVVGGRAYVWTGALSWGHEPYGQDPIVWTCELCKALTADIPGHNRWHRTTDTKEA